MILRIYSWSSYGCNASGIYTELQTSHEDYLRLGNKTFYLASQSSDWMATIDVKNLKIIKQIKIEIYRYPLLLLARVN